MVNGILRRSPLDPKLLQESYPLKFKVPKIEAYNGTSNPQDHMDIFISLMEIQTTRDDLLCRVFPLTLKGISYQWYANLPVTSITDFSDLGRKFLAQHSLLLRMNNNSLKYERSPTHESKRNPIKEKVQPLSQPEEKRIKLSMSSRKSPLDSKLLQEPYSLKFKVPKFETYRGTSDPQEHIDKFISLMEIQTARDDLLCRVFPLTLKGISYQWFANLPSASITDFSDLGQKFLAQHTALLRVKNEPYILGNIEHGNLSLRDYTKKFTEALTTIPDMIPGPKSSFVIDLFMKNLNDEHLLRDLFKNKAHTVTELLERARKFIEIEDQINWRDYES